MEYRDAGQSYGKPEVATSLGTEKYYPHLDIDLLKFPELSKDLGEECTLTVKVRVTAKRLNETEKCQTFEVRSIGIGADDEDENEGNEADKVLAKLKGSSARY